MGNCLDKSASDDENLIESDLNQIEINQNANENSQHEHSDAEQVRSRRGHRSHRHNRGHSHRHRHHRHEHHNSSLSRYISTSSTTSEQASQFSQSLNGPLNMTNNNYSSSSLSSGSLSIPNNGNLSSSFNSSHVFYLTPNIQRTADQLTEEEQIKLLKRMTLIQQLPSGSYDENKKNRECVICMIDFEKNDRIKYLPCLHTFHESCIDTWLIRSLICPSCMEPIECGLLATYE